MRDFDWEIDLDRKRIWFDLPVYPKKRKCCVLDISPIFDYIHEKDHGIKPALKFWN
jgi:hypothetical protein